MRIFWDHLSPRMIPTYDVYGPRFSMQWKPGVMKGFKPLPGGYPAQLEWSELESPAYWREVLPGLLTQKTPSELRYPANLPDAIVAYALQGGSIKIALLRYEMEEGECFNDFPEWMWGWTPERDLAQKIPKTGWERLDDDDGL